MASTEFRHVSWGDEVITSAKLQQMADNEEFLNERRLVTSFRTGVTKNTGLKLLTGTVYLPANKQSHAFGNVYFGSFFSPGCRPVVVATPATYPAQRVACNIQGIGSIANPDHRGFRVFCFAANREAKNAKILHAVNIHWHAMGW